MREQDRSVGHRNHVVVERARCDRFLGLLGEQRPLRIETVQTRDRPGRFEMLSGGEGAAGDAVDEDFDTRLAMRGRQAHVVRRALVPERRRHRRMNREVRFVAEG